MCSPWASAGPGTSSRSRLVVELVGEVGLVMEGFLSEEKDFWSSILGLGAGAGSGGQGVVWSQERQWVSR